MTNNKTLFDLVIDRRGTSCTKFAPLEELKSQKYDVIIPLWIADMDFATPEPIIEAIKRRLDHPILGYTVPPKAYCEVLKEWFAKRYDLEIATEEVCYTPGIVSGIYKLLQCLTKEGEGVTIMPPVYPPFTNVVQASRRKLYYAPLKIVDNRYEIDFSKLEEALKVSKALILCHPHNPGGRVWSVEELQQIARLAKKHNVYVISDEIHADLTFKEYQHHPFASVSAEASEVGISLMAPSKAFNMPGVIASHLYIPNSILREEVFTYMTMNGLDMPSSFTYDAVIAAYSECDEWLSDCLDYVRNNVNFVAEYLATHIPEVGMITPEASFLIFLDFRSLGFESCEELNNFIIDEAGILLNGGETFGPGGEMFMRLNVGVSRSVLEQAMDRLRKAIKSLR